MKRGCLTRAFLVGQIPSPAKQEEKPDTCIPMPESQVSCSLRGLRNCFISRLGSLQVRAVAAPLRFCCAAMEPDTARNRRGTAPASTQNGDFWDSLKTITMLVMLLAVLATPASAETDTELNEKIDSLFVLASNPEAHHQHLVEPSREELAQLGKQAVPRLVSKLTTEDARERHALANIFRRIGPPAVPALVEALDTDNLSGLRNTARCLGEVGDKSATPALLPLFLHDNHTVRSTAVTAVGKSHDSSAVDNCITMLSDEAEPVRKSAAVALGRIADHRAVRRLIDALQDPHYSVRMSAVGSLITVGHPSCDSLISQYGDLSDLGRYLAFEVWAGCKYAPAKKLLEKATHSEISFTRAFAIQALAAVDVKKARKRIEKMRNTETDLFVQSRMDAAEELLDSVSD